MIHLPSATVETAQLAKLFAYQPFILPDGTVTGVGPSWLTGTKARSIHPSADGFAEFKAGNERLARMYDDMIQGLVGIVGSIAGMSYLDMACNAGYFCYRMLQRGAASATGVDADDFGPAFEAANAALGLDAKFVRAKYDMLAHRFDGFDGRADLATCIAFMCHSSDPTFLIRRLSDLAGRALMIWSSFPKNHEYTVTYSRQTGRYFNEQFPICFDATTTVSDSLLIFGLKECGFTRVVEIPRQAHWLMDQHWRCFVAVR